MEKKGFGKMAKIISGVAIGLGSLGLAAFTALRDKEPTKEDYERLIEDEPETESEETTEDTDEES